MRLTRHLIYELLNNERLRVTSGSHVGLVECFNNSNTLFPLNRINKKTFLLLNIYLTLSIAGDTRSFRNQAAEIRFVQTGRFFAVARFGVT